MCLGPSGRRTAREEEKEQDGRDLPPVLKIMTLWLQKMPLCEFEPVARSCCCSQLAAAGLPGSRNRIKWKKEKKEIKSWHFLCPDL